MQAITTIGLDIAKSVFQVHGVDADGHMIIRRQLKRRQVTAFFQKMPPCLVVLGCLLLGVTASSLYGAT
jgi:transposase